jgi:hypothetical protein
VLPEVFSKVYIVLSSSYLGWLEYDVSSIDNPNKNSRSLRTTLVQVLVVHNFLRQIL